MELTMELHVWGGAFGLPSIDPECLATIAYFTQTLSPGVFTLIPTSPSAVPTNQLPSLYIRSTNTWIPSFAAITAFIQTATSISMRTTGVVRDGPPLTPAQKADSAAYTAFLALHAAPLLALSLYVSSANWAAGTRPAYSAILPFPLAWTEPPAIRAAMTRRAEHLGMSALDTDAVAEKEERLEAAAAAAGWVTAKKTVREMLAPEQKGRIRLERLAGDVLEVLAAVDWDGVSRETRCLGLAYLALMDVTALPRPWLSDVMREKYPTCAQALKKLWAAVFPPGSKLLWVRDGPENRVLRVGARFANGLIKDVPVFGQAWHRFWAGVKRRALQSQAVGNAHKGSVGTSLAANMLFLTFATSAVLGFGSMAGYGPSLRSLGGLPAFGLPLQIWKRPLSGLAGAPYGR
ncbi:Tom37 C-terminal domain-containing protein [Lasiosphaeris hirsuta]|uniref:Tom37 C-terminal domain-containing protein n=1 Tax=Lasiosphaeris hirsuta TaxID=260670 RepID=A0AA40BCQ7_9PEZI|nr:Tom37 C-terminal domain-containing protein [Lasiosphaeris hirsuta]